MLSGFKSFILPHVDTFALILIFLNLALRDHVCRLCCGPHPSPSPAPTPPQSPPLHNTARRPETPLGTQTVLEGSRWPWADRGSLNTRAGILPAKTPPPMQLRRVLSFAARWPGWRQPLAYLTSQALEWSVASSVGRDGMRGWLGRQAEGLPAPEGVWGLRCLIRAGERRNREMCSQCLLTCPSLTLSLPTWEMGRRVTRKRSPFRGH